MADREVEFEDDGIPMDVKGILEASILASVEKIKEEDFVESIELQSIWWDIYRISTPGGPALLALRLDPDDGHVHIGAVQRSVALIKQVMTSGPN